MDTHYMLYVGLLLGVLGILAFLLKYSSHFIWRALFAVTNVINAALLLSVIVDFFGINLLQSGSFGLHPSIVDFFNKNQLECILGTAFWLGLTLLSFISNGIKKRSDLIESEVELYKPSGELKPEDLGFKAVDVGNNPDPSWRSYYQKYIPRSFSRFSPDGIASGSERINEHELSDGLQNADSFIILGQPYEGKSRTLYEIIHSLDGYQILVPKKEKALPSNEFLSLLKHKRILLLLNDLNDFAGREADLKTLAEAIKNKSKSLVIAATCRDGPELGVVRESASALNRLYEDIQLKISLIPMTLTEKRELGIGIGKEVSDQDYDIAPTPGFITETSSLEAMRLRFQKLGIVEADLLRAMKLLVIAGVLPLTHARAKAVFEGIFARTEANIDDLLGKIGNLAFIHGPFVQDPIIPEAAYLKEVVKFQDGTGPDLQCLIPIFSNTGDGLGLFYLGITFGAKHHNHQKALDCFEQSIKYREDFSEAWTSRGAALAALGKYDDALTSHDRALATDPINARAWTNRGAALGNLGKYEEALSSCDKALVIKPIYALAWGIRGFALAELGRYYEAISSFDKAVEIDPKDDDAWYNRGVVLGVLGRYDEAVSSYEEAVTINPKYVKAWNNLGVALENLGRHDEALSSYEQALALDPKFAQAWANRGAPLLRLGKHGEALSSCDQAHAIDPKIAEAWYIRAVTLTMLGELDEAIKSISKAEELGWKTEATEEQILFLQNAWKELNFDNDFL
ncbi:tetratricopeptide repeat protein [Candidatus Acetothermia bacterium]|nr:tetratricopeptide repeat protein [Candidatus Acetothermia bacterium]